MSSFSITTSLNFLPRLVEMIGRRLETMGTICLPLTSQAFIEKAKRTSGLTDFGGMEFLEPLDRLLTSFHEEANLNFLGRIAAHHEIAQILENRLFLTEERRINPSIAETPIVSPLFILGLPRTGTTFLHALLSQDPGVRAPLTWEVMFPSSRTGSRRRRITRARRNLAIFSRLSPRFGAIHPTEALLPQECITLMSHAFLSDEFDNMFDIPSYSSWLQKQDLMPAYEWHRRFLQHLQRGMTELWILKAPTHLASLPSLLEIYPDARFIQTHRAPAEAMRSLTSMTSVLRSTFSDSPFPDPAGRELIRYWATNLRKFSREREQIDPGKICDVQLTEIQRDPMFVAHKIYSHFGLTLSIEAEKRMRSYLVRNRRKDSAPHWSSKESPHFDPVESRFFADYSARYGV